MEQFDLLRRYLLARHAQGGMADMTWPDYVAMVEDTAVRTHLIEYRLPSGDGGPGDLVACVLVDILGDGLSLVYSFYEPAERVPHVQLRLEAERLDAAGNAAGQARSDVHAGAPSAPAQPVRTPLFH